MKRLTTAAAFSCLFVTAGLSGAGAASASTPSFGKLDSVITGSGQMDGDWTLAFTPSGHLDVSHNGKKVGNGSTYAFSGGDVTFMPGTRGQCTTDGVYSYVVSGGSVTFQTISDSCTSRNDVLTFGPWSEVH